MTMPDETTLEYALIVINQCNTDGRIKVDRQELKEAIKLIHKEIRYRIPRKLEKDGDADKFFDDIGNCTCLHCANCGAIPFKDEKYCYNCGQALDWN